MIHSNSFFPYVSYIIVDVIIFFALVHFFIVSASIVQPGATAPLLEFNDVFDPAKDSQAAFMNMVTNYPNFVAEEWPHVLTWDLFIGRYIWLDGLKRGRWFSSTHKSIFAIEIDRVTRKCQYLIALSLCFPLCTSLQEYSHRIRYYLPI